MRAAANSAAAAPLVVLAVMAVVACGASGRITTPSQSPAFAAQCPQTDATVLPSSNPRTASVLVPPHPTGVRVCRYWGHSDFGSHWTLVAGDRYVRESHALARLVSELDALQPETPPYPSCPVFGGRSILLIFHYTDASDVRVRLSRVTCPRATNGRLARLALGLTEGEHWPDEGLI
jgi:hypothetical protein